MALPAADSWLALSMRIQLAVPKACTCLQMGLGKTAQSVATMACIQQAMGPILPFLVIAPLTTLGHWVREIETWTDMVRSFF